MTIAGKHKYESIERAEQYSLFIDRIMDEKDISSTREAVAIGKADSLLTHYRSINSERNYPAYAIPMSLFADEQMNFLAKQCGGMYVSATGKVNGSTKDEQAMVLNAIADMTKCSEIETERKSWIRIEKAVARAMKELGK